MLLLGCWLEAERNFVSSVQSITLVAKSSNVKVIRKSGKSMPLGCVSKGQLV